VKQALADAIEARGYDTLTPVQEACGDPALEGRDLLVSAQTGSGKTLGFGIAIAPNLLGDAERFDRADAPLALVIAPTRELALQVKRELEWLYEKTGAVIASTVGGMDMRDERRALGRGAHIVVSTPGRLRDHIMRKSIDLSNLKAVVLDEADEMLDLGFREDLEFILDESPKDRQTLLFSATVPASIAKLAQRYQRNAERVATTTGEKQHADIEYRAFRVSARDTENAIINVLRYFEAPNAIVFCNTRATVNRMTTRLSNRGFSVVALSGELSQTERTHALQSMRDGRARVCVATDVAARGIDLPNLDLVIHAELPTNQDTLLHRSGRTGRAGRKGTSAMIVPPAVRKKAERLLGWAKLTATWADAPSADEVTAKDEERMLEDTDWSADVEESATAMVATMAERFAPEQLAAAYLRLYREKHTAPEELSDVGEPAKPRQAFGPSVWFSLPGGRDAGAEPRRILPMICKMGNITKDDIGAIRIQPDTSYIEVREASVKTLTAALGSDMTLENGAPLTRVANPPSFERGPARKESKPRYDGPKSGGKPDYKSGDKPDYKNKDKPAYKAKDKSDFKPAAEKPFEKPEPKPSGNTTPVDWNDTSTPKPRKPKVGAKPKYDTKKPYAGKNDKNKASDDTIEPIKARKPYDDKSGGKPYAGKPAGKPYAGKDAKTDAGGSPAQGKASSKKNRARQLAAKGGTAAPRKPRAKS
jgi:ATP-dependent RNA helicase DeaD